MATPHVAGAVALLWSARPELRRDIVGTENILNHSAVPVPSFECSSNGRVPNNSYGWGRLDVKSAVDIATRSLGRVTSMGYGLPGVTVHFARISGSGSVPPPVTTDAQGKWSQDRIRSGFPLYGISQARKLSLRSAMARVYRHHNCDLFHDDFETTSGADSGQSSDAMKTRVTRSPRIAAGFIERGEVVAFPTETVYGLGASLLNEDAIRKVFRAKGRPADNPLIAHVASREQILIIARKIPPIAEKLIEAFFPGPITLVLPRHPSVPRIATAGLDTIGVRMPRHTIAQELISHFGGPLAAPSANLSGRPSPTRWQDAKADLDGRIACILKGDQTEVGLESTVVDCTGKGLVVLRAGAVTLEDLESVAGRVRVARHTPGKTPKSPGHEVPSLCARSTSQDCRSSGRNTIPRAFGVYRNYVRVSREQVSTHS